MNECTRPGVLAAMRLGLAVTWIALIACSGPERAARSACYHACWRW